MSSRRPRPAVSGKAKSQVPVNNEDEYDDEEEYEEEEEEEVKRPKTKDDRILCFVPSEGIDLEVIRATLPLPSFLGPKASVSHGKHPSDNRRGYHVRTYRTLTVLMLSDLKMDTIKWHDEVRGSNNRDYKQSNTLRMRLKNGPTGDAPAPIPTSTAPVTLFDQSSRKLEKSYQESYTERSDRGQQAQSQREYDEQNRPSDTYPRSNVQGAMAQGQDNRSAAYTQAATSIYIQNIQQSRNPAGPVAPPAAQPTYTRQDVERQVMERLRERGQKEITRSQLDRAVDSAMRQLQEEASAREERATSVPPAFIENVGAPGQPKPAHPSTTGTRGFPSHYVTAGPDYSRHLK